MISDKTCPFRRHLPKSVWAAAFCGGTCPDNELHPALRSWGRGAGYTKRFSFPALWAGLEQLCMGYELVVPVSKLCHMPDLEYECLLGQWFTLELHGPLEITWSRDFKTYDVVKGQAVTTEAGPSWAGANWRWAFFFQGRPCVARSPKLSQNARNLDV